MQRTPRALLSVAAPGASVMRLEAVVALRGLSSMRRRTPLRAQARLCGVSATWVQAAHVHESPFIELPQDLARGEAYEVARDALLQLNVMIRRGIEPDALMYTSLIDTMGRAGLEWQAYKLFSRMVEQNVRPLPETYVALRDATSKSRVRLRDDIQAKIEETMAVLPQELAEDVMARQKEEDRQCIAKFDEYMRGEAAVPMARLSSENINTGSGSTDSSVGGAYPSDRDAVMGDGGDARRGQNDGAQTTTTRTSSDANTASSPISTMRIRNPTDVWHTARLAETLRGAPQLKAAGDAAEHLGAALRKLHEEELRIYLAAQRQLRHGTHEELVQRVLSTVSERAIRDMLARRQHYFRSVEEILGNDLRELRMSGLAEPTGQDGTAPSTPSMAADSPTTHERDRTLHTKEKEEVAPEVLHTPWGIIRKPSRPEAGPPTSRNTERLERVRLSEHELVLVRQRAETKALDELPESLLRRYAYQFQLRWRRRDPLSLLEAVQWHATTFIPQAVLQSDEAGTVLAHAQPTPPVRLQEEHEGMHRTLENFEAFRVISQRTNNLQVVDNKEINLQLKRVRQDANKKEKKANERLRRERNVMAAAGLAASARTFTLPPDDESPQSHILGLDQMPKDYGGAIDGNQLSGASQDPCVSRRSSEDSRTAPSSSTETPPLEKSETRSAQMEEAVEELPPWALFDGEDEFNLTTGRFGNAEMGRYRELSDSKFQVLPSRAAQQRWSVDRQLLPSTLQDVVRQAELQLQARHESIEQEYEEKLQYKRYKKWDGMIQKAQAKKKQRSDKGRPRHADDVGDEDDEAVKPLPPRRRLSQVLRKGSDRDRVSAQMREKFTRSL